MDNPPYLSEEQVNMIDLRHLIQKGWNVVYEFSRVGIHDDIQINSVFSAGKESLPVATSIRRTNQCHLMLHWKGPTRLNPPSRLASREASG